MTSRTPSEVLAGGRIAVAVRERGAFGAPGTSWQRPEQDAPDTGTPLGVRHRPERAADRLPQDVDVLVVVAGQTGLGAAARPHGRWVDVPGALGHDGGPLHTARASPATGLHRLGLPWQTRRSSSTTDGVDRDARAIAQPIRTGAEG